jgi:hypothetical protein
VTQRKIDFIDHSIEKPNVSVSMKGAIGVNQRLKVE